MKISEIRKAMEDLDKENNENIFIMEELDEIIRKISTRQASFNEMYCDEKLKEIGNVLEFLLKKDGNFITLNYEYISLGFISDEDIKQIRKKVQCFRHSTEESLQERKGYTNIQKQFMIEFGIIICNLIYNELKES